MDPPHEYATLDESRVIALTERSQVTDRSSTPQQINMGDISVSTAGLTHPNTKPNKGNSGVMKVKSTVVILLMTILLVVMIVGIGVIVWLLTRLSTNCSKDCTQNTQVTKETSMTATLETSAVASPEMCTQQTMAPCSTPLCPEGYPFLRPGSNSCYRIARKDVKFTAAVADCASDGGYLVAVESEEENNWVYQLTEDKYTWLGGSDEGNEGNWVWIGTGQPFNYTNWMPGEPNNREKIEHTLIIGWSADANNAEWNDYDANLMCQSICEIQSYM